MTFKGIRVVLTTLGDAARAKEIATVLVEEKLVACANIIGPVTSVYRWEGKVEEDQEYVVLMKTADYPSLEERLCELHPYDLPEIIELSITAGQEEYLAWIRDSCSSPRR